MNAIMILAQALIEPGDNAVLIAPLWPNLGDTVRVMGGEAREVPLTATPEGGWRLDLDRVFAAFDDHTRALYVNSPNNPTGWTLSLDEARALLTETRRRGIYLIADEVYARLVYDGARAAPSLVQLAEPEDRVVSVNSFSKAWAMTGWRLGWMVAPPEIRNVVDALIEINTSCAPPFIQHAGVAALEQGEGFVEHMREHCRRGRDILVQGLARFPRVHVAPRPGPSMPSAGSRASPTAWVSPTIWWRGRRWAPRRAAPSAPPAKAICGCATPTRPTASKRPWNAWRRF